jgi:hypothetical protein
MAAAEWNPQPGEWFLVIDLCQPASGVLMDERTGRIVVPFATRRSAMEAGQAISLSVAGSALAGEVVTERAEIEGG